MLQNEIKKSFTDLGLFLSQFQLDGFHVNTAVKNNDLFQEEFSKLIELSQSHNGWFTPENVHFAIQSWATALKEENLNKWLSTYKLEDYKPKTVGLVLAGNIPLVGFHDLLSVLIVGHKALIKTSSNDQYLVKFLIKYLISLDSRISERITLAEGKLEGFDAVIATGSNNTARYFEYYFKNKPNIIRKNRNSVAILTGEETKEELVALGDDIFRYFGLGCRNVSKLFIPEGYNFDNFFNAIFEFQEVVKYEKYANNYDYNKAVYLMSNFKLLDNGFLTLKEDTSFSSPISSVFYEYYTSIESLTNKLEKDKEKIQCIVSKNQIMDSISFGETQKPNLWDYSDNIDTLQFLINL
ncbi:acyl-CoA reductase [Flavobacterium sp.]|uniref:acyl-CoA reductase n=1 Tax=Flavobacterium sp. TaxID=239 RepID=UPI004047C514